MQQNFLLEGTKDKCKRDRLIEESLAACYAESVVAFLVMDNNNKAIPSDYVSHH